jgi:hypothetical protein
LSRRVIGETERAAAAKCAAAALPPISPDEWIEMRVEPGAEWAGARDFVALVEELGGEPVVSPSRDSINAKFTGNDGRSFNAMQLWKKVVSLPFGYLTERRSVSIESYLVAAPVRVGCAAAQIAWLESEIRDRIRGC